MIKILSKKVTSICTSNPIFVLCITLFATALIMGGIRHVKQDDNMINLLPDNIGSRKIFREIQNEYGLTEYMYVALGNKNSTFIKKDNLEVIWELTHEFEKLDIVDEVISLSNVNKISLDHADSSLVIEDLMTTKTLSKNQIKNLKNYLNQNPIIKKRLISNNNDYTNIRVIGVTTNNILVLLLSNYNEKSNDKTLCYNFTDESEFSLEHNYYIKIVDEYIVYIKAVKIDVVEDNDDGTDEADKKDDVENVVSYNYKLNLHTNSADPDHSLDTNKAYINYNPIIHNGYIYLRDYNSIEKIEIK